MPPFSHCIWLVALCAAGMGSRASASHPGTNFCVTDFGARPGGQELATAAFRAAVAAARHNGGGIVEVPPGHFLSGPIELASHVTLRLDPGSVLEFPVTALPFVRGRYLGVEALVPHPLIDATDCDDVALVGSGRVVTADYEAWRRAYPDAYAEEMAARHGHILTGGNEAGSANGPRWDALLRALNAHHPVAETDYRAAAPELRPMVARFFRCSHARVENVRFSGGPDFVVQLLYCDNVQVRGISVEAYPGPHANGIVVDSSRFVRISGCYVDTGDDGIVIKAGKDADGLRVARPSEDIAIVNCTVHHAHGAIVIGSETAGGVRAVVASNITAIDTECGVRIKTRRGRGGVVEGIRLDNAVFQHVGTGILVTSYYVMGGESSAQAELLPVGPGTPVLRDIAVSHVTLLDNRVPIDVEGLPEMPVQELALTDITGTAELPAIYRFVTKPSLREVNVRSAAAPR